MAALIAALFITLGLGVPGAGAFPNGGAPPSAVAPIATGVKCDGLQGQLRNDAAGGWNTMALGAGEKLPTNGCASAYRMVGQPSDWPPPVYGTQWYFRGEWCSRGACGNAAVPGTSGHGNALCVDVPQFVRGYIDLHGAQFGYSKSWSDAPHEWWHVCFNPAAFNRPDPGVSQKYPKLRKGSGGPGQNIPVRKLQKLLRGHGDKSVRVDGEFGRSTAIAVRRFQKAEHIKINGVVSKRVWKRLRRPVVEPLPVAPAPAVPVQPKPNAPKPPKPTRPTKPIRGLDVSVFQYEENGRPVEIDWRAVRRDGYRFAYLKATEGQDFLDRSFTRSELKEAVRAGLAVGAYHFMRPRLDRTGAREAAWFIQVVGQAGAVGKGYLRSMLDIEENAQEGPDLTPEQMCRYTGSFLRTVRRSLGFKMPVYTTPGFARQYFGDCGWLGRYQLWVAHIGVDRPEVVFPWKRYVVWQHTWTGRVAGVFGDVDLNVMPGGLPALRKLQIKGLLKQAKTGPRAMLELPLEAEPRQHLRNKVPAADKRPFEPALAAR